MTSFAPLARAFARDGVRYVLIGVSGANLHAHSAGLVFTTLDRDVFLPADPENLLAAWRACEGCGLQLWSSGELLDEPRDVELARWVVQARALTHATDGGELRVDLTLVMAGFEFDEVWADRATFVVGDAQISVARLTHIIASKAAAGRDKDRLFLATHEEALREILPPEERDA